MRGLQGDLGTMSLKELVVHLAGRKASGKLTFGCREVGKEVTLVGGEVVNARSNLAREYLGQFLINSGLISEDQFHKAYETQQETRIYLGKILAMIGLVTEDQVASALSLKFSETLLSAFEWSEGEFTFVPGEPAALLEGVEVRVSLEEILREAESRETAWEAIRSVFPSGALRLMLHPEKWAEPPQPGSVDARIADLVQEGLTIEEMALGLHATDFFLYQRLYALHCLGAISLGGPGPDQTLAGELLVDEILTDETLADEPLSALELAAEPEPTAPPEPVALEPVATSGRPALEPIIGLEPSAEEMALTARTLLDEGNPRDAAALAARAAELSSLPEHRELQRKAETQWLAHLRKELLYQDLIPTLQVPAEDLKQLALSAPQRYLLSRVDGLRTLRAIVQSSPVPELEALRAFRDFADGQVLALTPRAA